LKPRFLVPLAVFIALVGVLAVGINHSPDVGVLKSPLVGHEIPDWQLPVLTDPTKSLGSRDLKGQWYVLNYWGAWCYSCRVEHPTLLQAQREARVQIIGVDWVADVADENAAALDMLSRLGNPYSKVVTDRDGRTAIDLGIAQAPESLLVNPQGVIVYKEPGVITPEIWRREFLSRLPPQSTVPVASTGGS
jgi:cytochrome c biogenesis protein CcmG, thiol:disulfide interchange protein DsbE